MIPSMHLQAKLALLVGLVLASGAFAQQDEPNRVSAEEYLREQEALVEALRSLRVDQRPDQPRPPPTPEDTYQAAVIASVQACANTDEFNPRQLCWGKASPSKCENLAYTMMGNSGGRRAPS
jgi:hypothetical protein